MRLDLERHLMRCDEELFLALSPDAADRLGLAEGATIRVAVAAGTSPKPGRPSAAAMEGKRVPSFAMPDQDGGEVTDKGLEGKPYVLYFYPKDDTPGCTKEACGIRDAWDGFDEAGLRVYGVSRDDAGSHQAFRQKYDLPFDLLVADEPTLERFGVWKEKNMYGRRFMGINRETLLVGGDGTVLKHYKKVKPEEHAVQLLSDWKALR